MRLKRYAMPRWWRVPRKSFTWIKRPTPGPHNKESCLPLQVILRDILNVVKTASEAKKVVKAGKVFVDKRVRKDTGFPVGLMDVVEMPDLKKAWRVVPSKRGLILKETNKPDQKICRIEGKRIIKGGKIQLSLHDGRNVLVKEKNYKVGDSLVIEIPNQKILGHIPFKIGQQAFVIGGKNIGAVGTIKAVDERKSIIGQTKVTIHTPSGDVQTLKKYVVAGVMEEKV